MMCVLLTSKVVPGWSASHTGPPFPRGAPARSGGGGIHRCDLRSHGGPFVLSRGLQTGGRPARNPREGMERWPCHTGEEHVGRETKGSAKPHVHAQQPRPPDLPSRPARPRPPRRPEPQELVHVRRASLGMTPREQLLEDVSFKTVT